MTQKSLFAPIAARFGFVFIDQYGVLHDGMRKSDRLKIGRVSLICCASRPFRLGLGAIVRTCGGVILPIGLRFDFPKTCQRNASNYYG